MPQLSQTVTITMATPGKDIQLVLRGTVTWLNPRQQHPVHSLPPGFGVKFDELARGPPLHRGRGSTITPAATPDAGRARSGRRYAALSSLTR